MRKNSLSCCLSTSEPKRRTVCSGWPYSYGPIPHSSFLPHFEASQELGKQYGVVAWTFLFQIYPSKQSSSSVTQIICLCSWGVYCACVCVVHTGLSASDLSLSISLPPLTVLGQAWRRWSAWTIWSCSSSSYTFKSIWIWLSARICLKQRWC